MKRLLPMNECIDVIEEVFKTLARGDVVLPLRQTVRQPDKKGLLGLMPAYMGSPRAIGGKFITVFPGNLETPYESHQGVVLLFETENGRLLSMVDASTITAIRTAAASGVATRVLARKDASRLAILGSGTQAKEHLESMRAVRRLTKVLVWSRSRGRAESFAKAWDQNDLHVEAVPTAREAVVDSDIVCTTTGATAPILEGKWLSPGTHVNAVGASLPGFRELDSEAVIRARLYTDRRESLFNEADDFRIPLREGLIGEGHMIGEIGEVLTGKVSGRVSDQDITLFKSLGIAVEDLASAYHIYSKAQEEGTGTWVDFSGKRGGRS